MLHLIGNNCSQDLLSDELWSDTIQLESSSGHQSEFLPSPEAKAEALMSMIKGSDSPMGEAIGMMEQHELDAVLHSAVSFTFLINE